MNELITLLTNRVGIPQDKAQQAVDVVLSYVKNKLPNQVSTQVENIISPGGGSVGSRSGSTGNEPNTFGGTSSGSGTGRGSTPKH